MKVIVVGAGAIGASIAYHLVRAGAEVVVVQGGQPAASNASFGWINASFYADAAHHRLRAAGLAGYGRLLAEFPDLAVRNTGALWFEDQGAGLEKMHGDLTGLNYPVERINAAQAGEPAVRGLPDQLLRFPSESAAEAGVLARQLLTASGAQIVSGVTVTGIAVQGESVKGVVCDMGVIEADRVVVAGGNGTPEVLKSVDVALPMLTRPGVLVTTKPIDKTINSILVTPFGEVRQLPDGRILASAVANHQGDDASEVTERPADIAARVLAWLQPMIDAPLVWEQVALAYRPVPQDGLPVIGAVGPDGLHVAVMHSGVTLAAIVGEAVADEVLGKGAHDDLLAPYRPQRFQ